MRRLRNHATASDAAGQSRVQPVHRSEGTGSRRGSVPGEKGCHAAGTVRAKARRHPEHGNAWGAQPPRSSHQRPRSLKSGRQARAAANPRHLCGRRAVRSLHHQLAAKPHQSGAGRRGAAGWVCGGDRTGGHRTRQGLWTRSQLRRPHHFSKLLLFIPSVYKG